MEITNTAFKRNIDIYDEFVALDIETTGLSAKTDKIIEIGAVAFCHGQVTGEYKCFVNPQIHISSRITQLTGITDAMVKDAPTISHVLPEFIIFAGKKPIVAHNAAFDMGFIRQNALLLGLHISNPVVCTLQLCRKLYRELENHKLNTLTQHLGVKLENHHRALDDSMAAAQIYLKCMEHLKQNGCK